MKKREVYIFSAGLLFTAFLFLTFLVFLGYFVGLDSAVTATTQSIIPSSLITPFSLFSLIGTTEVIGVFFLLVLFFSKVKRIYVLILFVLVGIIEITGKTLINHPPPPPSILKTDISVNFPTDSLAHVMFSYPSGHSARSAFVSGFIILLVLVSKKLTSGQKKILIGGVLIFDLIMFVSRVYLGEHWVSDVAGGALLGFSLALFISYFLDFRSSKS